MAFFSIDEDVELYYRDLGHGQPVVFIHGAWMSHRFFQKQTPYFSQTYRSISFDLRGHGRSTKVPYGHTVANYARDLRAFLDGLKLKEAILVGWSLGGMLIWEYFNQFGAENLSGVVIVNQPASDFRWDDWPQGLVDLSELRYRMQAIQTDWASYLNGFIPSMFRHPQSHGEFRWMFEEITRLPESIAGAILFDKTLQDYRPLLSKVSLPTLLCFGAHDKLVPVTAGHQLAAAIPDSRLVIFKDSGHCPFFEQPDEFNAQVDKFIRAKKETSKE